jgi:chaperone modulatory protein CbpM
MKSENLVTANDFCSHHHIDVSFVRSLSDFGLIETTVISNELFLSEDDLEKLEKIIAFHYQLNINLEGVEAIGFLLQKIEEMQLEINYLKNRLRFYE